jgi:hypothetical protein
MLDSLAGRIERAPDNAGFSPKTLQHFADLKEFSSVWRYYIRRIERRVTDSKITTRRGLEGGRLT